MLGFPRPAGATGNSHSAATSPDYGPVYDTGRRAPLIYAANRCRVRRTAVEAPSAATRLHTLLVQAEAIRVSYDTAPLISETNA